MRTRSKPNDSLPCHRGQRNVPSPAETECPVTVGNGMPRHPCDRGRNLNKQKAKRPDRESESSGQTGRKEGRKEKKEGKRLKPKWRKMRGCRRDKPKTV
ncbi:hypothetical protein D9C73_012553 [Collichthys lucidus]|uniref:Uncharacterized protein n=1 Tax=Collichthys lucidus TaxID=240159 RepID=A0A4U5UVA0_COLLU|nr:hypothetical protein D9C73_012553 [Collichthys lucidus]